MKPSDIVAMRFDGGWDGALKPSSEWHFHLGILRDRPDAGAVLHAHSSFATAIACLGRDIPAFHYMVAVAGGRSIRCAPYATFGTEELSQHALAALDGRKACLLANHGMIAPGCGSRWRARSRGRSRDPGRAVLAGSPDRRTHDTFR